MMYPGVGDSTFRIVESGNNFPDGDDFSTTTFEDQVIRQQRRHRKSELHV